MAVVSAVLDDALGAYAEGLRVESRSIRFEDVRRGFDAAIALRSKLAVDAVDAVAGRVLG